MIDYIWIRDQAHEMWAEGSADTEPSIADVVLALTNKGW